MIVQTDDDEMMMKVTVAVVCLLHHMTTHGLVYLYTFFSDSPTGHTCSRSYLLMDFHE